MLKINNLELLKLERQLKQINKVAFPIATRSTLNSAAFLAREKAQANIKDKFILRNRFTLRSVRVETTRTLDVNAQQSKTGSVQAYMADQEFGATRVKTGKHGIAIPTSVASGEGRGVVPRKRLVRKANILTRIRFKKKRIKAKSRKQFVFLAIKFTAEAKANRFVFLPLKKHPGIYKIFPRKATLKQSRRGQQNHRIELIHDLSKSSVRIPASPWLQPAARETQRHMGRLFQKSAIFQFRRAGMRAF